MATPKVVTVPITDQQHMLFLFIPLKKGTQKKAVEAVHQVKEAAETLKSSAGYDPRKTTGVHYFTIYHQAAGEKTPGIPVPGFQSCPDKDVLVVMSIYDGQFDAYISAFFALQPVVDGLNLLLALMDETGIEGVDPDGPTSANYILQMKGVQKNPLAFYCLLMRYNFGDPVYCAGDKGGKYVFGTNFPGLSVAKIIDNYPDADKNWPLAGDVTFDFPKAQKPNCE